jgi:hypothetical protein
MVDQRCLGANPSGSRGSKLSHTRTNPSLIFLLSSSSLKAEVMRGRKGALLFVWRERVISLSHRHAREGVDDAKTMRLLSATSELNRENHFFLFRTDAQQTPVPLLVVRLSLFATDDEPRSADSAEIKKRPRQPISRAGHEIMQGC